MSLKTYIICVLSLVSTQILAQQHPLHTRQVTFINQDTVRNVQVKLYRSWPAYKLVDTFTVSSKPHTITLTDSMPAVYTMNARKLLVFDSFIADADTLTIRLSKRQSTITGSTLTDAMNQEKTSSKDLEKRSAAVGNQYVAEKDLNKKILLEKLAGELFQEREARLVKFISQHANDVLGAWTAKESAGILRTPSLTKLMDLFEGKEWALPAYDKLRAAYTTQNQGLKQGSYAPAFSLKSIDGRNVSLADLLKDNDYLLIDFWASWCTPCRSTNRAIAPMYPELRRKKLAIVSISVDTKEDAWKKAVASDKIPWTQLLAPDALKSEVVLNYKVQSLPSTFLVDKTGKIIKTGIREDELKNYLK